MDGIPPLFQGGGEAQRGGDDVRRCGGHEAMVKEITAVGVHVSRSYQENREAWAAQRECNQAVGEKLSAIQTGLSALDPEATKSRLTFQGLVVSGIVSVIVAGLANADKVMAAIEKFR